MSPQVQSSKKFVFVLFRSHHSIPLMPSKYPPSHLKSLFDVIDSPQEHYIIIHYLRFKLSGIIASVKPRTRRGGPPPHKILPLSCAFFLEQFKRRHDESPPNPHPKDRSPLYRSTSRETSCSPSSRFCEDCTILLRTLESRHCIR